MNYCTSVIMLTTWLVTVGNIIPVSSQWFTVPMICMMSMIYQLIVWFMKWYMSPEVGLTGFLRLMLLFMASMVLYVGGNSMNFLYGWEYIGIMSFLLISFWGRNEAMGSSMSAVMYNRLGDFSVMMFCYCMESWVLGLLAVLGKSAIWIMGYWLPMAMEGPTPVSSLLHSSTMVVASVMLSMMLGGSLVLSMSSVLIMSMFLSTWFDGKKMVALSTSVHLAVMFLSVSVSLYGVCIMHIVTHSFIKATCFVASGIKIGMTSNQDTRMWGLEKQVMVMMLSFLMLSGVSGSMIYHSKEMILLQMTLVIVIVVGWKYTKMFLSNVSGMDSSMMVMRLSLCFLFVTGSSGFGGMELVTLLIVVSLLTPVMNSWSGYVVNK